MIKILFFIISLIFACNALESMSFETCESEKACFKSSKYCTYDNCDFAISWKPFSYMNNAYIEFEMVGTVFGDNSYMLVGFSDDKSLGNDGFISCHVEGKEVKIMAGSYEVRESVEPNIKFNDDEKILVTHFEKKYGGFYNEDTKRLTCRFLRRVKLENANRQLKDLSLGNEYYLFTARGNEATQYSYGPPFAGSLIFSKHPIDFSRESFNSVFGGYSRVDSSFAKTHGILMVIAWVFCSSVGVILARYYKEMWPYTGIAKEMVWFQFHRSLQGTCVLLTTVAFILIFASVGGYSKLDRSPYTAHPILGIIVFILAFLNPLVALCRCRPNSKDRPWFNWFHFFIGSIAYCLSVPTIMIGMRISGPGRQLAHLESPQWILIFFVLFQFAVEIILEIHGCLYYRRNKDKKHTYEMEMEEYQAALIANHAPQTKPIPPKQSGRMFKYFMLGMHAIVAGIVALLLVIIIAVN